MIIGPQSPTGGTGIGSSPIVGHVKLVANVANDGAVGVGAGVGVGVGTGVGNGTICKQQPAGRTPKTWSLIFLNCD